MFSAECTKFDFSWGTDTPNKYKIFWLEEFEVIAG